jgi:hypothetical protein
VNLDITFRALREVARPFIQDSITGGVPALDAGIRTFPIHRPFLRNTELLCSAMLRPARAALREFAPTIADALEAGIQVLPRTPRVQPRGSRRCSSELQTFAEDPMVPRGLRATTSALTPCSRRWLTSTPAQTHVQLRDAVVPQHLLAAQRGRPQRHLAAVHHRPPRRRGPTTRAARRPRRPTGPTSSNHLHTNPYPNTRRRASRRSARRATSRTARPDRDVGNRPARQSATTEGNPLMAPQAAAAGADRLVGDP